MCVFLFFCLHVLSLPALACVFQPTQEHGVSQPSRCLPEQGRSAPTPQWKQVKELPRPKPSHPLLLRASLVEASLEPRVGICAHLSRLHEDSTETIDSIRRPK